MQSSNDANLVTIEANLLDVLRAGPESILVVGEGDTAFRAWLSAPPPALRNGSTLRLTGVCRVGESSLAGQRFRANPLEMELLLRSPADITVLAAPSGWTP